MRLDALRAQGGAWASVGDRPVDVVGYADSTQYGFLAVTPIFPSDAAVVGDGLSAALCALAKRCTPVPFLTNLRLPAQLNLYMSAASALMTLGGVVVPAGARASSARRKRGEEEQGLE